MVVASLVLIAVLALSFPGPAPENKGPASVTVDIDFGGQTPPEATFAFANGSSPAGPVLLENVTDPLDAIYVATGPTNWTFGLRIDNGTVFGALEKAARLANFTFVSEWYPNFNSHRIVEIAGVRDGTDNRYWQYYLNGEYMGLGADLVGLSDGDTVRWEFRSAMQ